MTTQISPITNSDGQTDDQNTRSSADSEEGRSQTEGDDTMGKKVLEDGTVTSDASADDVTTVTEVEASTEEETREEVSVNTQPRSVEEYIAAAPVEMQEVLTESIRLHADRKGKIVKALKANDRCDYSEEELQAMSVTDLERMSKLANVPTYAGAAPSAPRTQSKQDDSPPKILEAFPVKGANAA